MSVPDLTAPAQPACPVCSAPLAPAQAWCLECGAAARTRIAPTPRWRPLALIAALAAILAILAIGFAIARFARGSSGPATGPPTTSVPATSQVVGAPATGVTP